MSVRLAFHGAAGCVTGAAFRLTTPDADVLIDCGLFQGPKTLKALNYGAFPFDPGRLDAILLTHAHLDHAGLIPKAMRAGFKGDVYATPETIALCAVMLPDAGKIQEMEVEQLNRRQRRRARDVVTPIYTAQDAETALRLFREAPFDRWMSPAAGLRARWWRAGHILGSASVEVEVTSGASVQRLLFSGDLGPGGRDFSVDPQGPSGVDHLIIESTYGARARALLTPAERRATLADEVRAAHRAGGPLLIPAFAVERTQELLVDLLAVMSEGLAPEGPIFLDSPLAIRATNVFLDHTPGDGAGANAFAAIAGARHLHFLESVGESRSLERVEGWHVIVAASGMCDAGRIRHHLKRQLWRPQASVLLTGYQAVGTLGRLLVEGRDAVRVQGETIAVRARIRQVEVYSGHADGPGLVAWAKARGPVAGGVFITHGEPAESAGLVDALKAAGLSSASMFTPEIDDAFMLSPGVLPQPVPPAGPRLPPHAAARLDWHNARAAFLVELEAALADARDDPARMALVTRLQDALRAT
jgi:metallo-beta-lactamase family protein